MAKLTKTAFNALVEDVSRRCRVQRPNVLEFMLLGGFSKLPKISSTVLDSPYQRWKGIQEGTVKGWVIPDDNLGRLQGRPNPSAAESVRLWIKQNMGSHVPADAVAVIYEEDQKAVVIYRKG